jgi:hypothetical protein
MYSSENGSIIFNNTLYLIIYKINQKWMVLEL